MFITNQIIRLKLMSFQSFKETQVRLLVKIVIDQILLISRLNSKLLRLSSSEKKTELVKKFDNYMISSKL
jgi:hypothetical protein